MANRTLAILKPDCIRRNLAGKVIDHLLNAGFKIIALKMVKLTKETAGEITQKSAGWYVDWYVTFYPKLAKTWNIWKIC